MPAASSVGEVSQAGAPSVSAGLPFFSGKIPAATRGREAPITLRLGRGAPGYCGPGMLAARSALDMGLAARTMPRAQSTAPQTFHSRTPRATSSRR